MRADAAGIVAFGAASLDDAQREMDRYGKCKAMREELEEFYKELRVNGMEAEPDAGKK